MRLLDIFTMKEAFDQKLAAEGTVKFSTSSFNDPHIQKALQYLSQQSKLPIPKLTEIINKKIATMAKQAEIVPSLYETMMKNMVESEVFNLMWKGIPDDSFEGDLRRQLGIPGGETPIGTDPVDVKFSDRLFMLLVRYIKAEHDEFFPLRGFVDRRPQMNESWVILPSANPAYKIYDDVKTAAATPTGVFLFDRTFCQKLLDYGSLKGIKGKGSKYVSNGGDIPDQYGYIEFLIIHELMHFSNDDFYYQHIIPNANPKIINWVGDFRSNYLLVKSGYNQLPMGLYNDKINYDRQSEYIQMYDIVHEEMKKLNPEQEKLVSGDMDGQGDDHGPGQGEGEKGPGAGNAKGKSTGDIDKNAERVEKEVGNSKDSADPAEQGEGDPGDTGSSDGRSSIGGTAGQQIDYTKAVPSLNWMQISKKFVGTAAPKTQETYASPHRRNATSAVMVAQAGAGAIKPAEKISEHIDITLMFVVDSSGSMSSAVAMAYANIAVLLKQPQFKKSDCIIARFSSKYDLHKANFAKNIAAKIGHIADKPKKYETTCQAVFNSHMGASTNFNGQLLTEIENAMKNKYNVLIFSDSDIFTGTENFNNLKMLIAKYPRSVFVLFDKLQTYQMYRQRGGPPTPNISHM